MERHKMSAIVFDLDGTLIDSAPDIHAAANRMLAGEDQAPLDLPTVISFVGNGLPKLVERIMRLRGLDMGQHQRLTKVTLDHYAGHGADVGAALTRIYPGVQTALRQLQDQGHTLGICTNKPEAPARSILNDLKLAGFFDVVVGGDTFAVNKPDPAPLLNVFNDLMQQPHIYVGDSEVDAETAQRAQVPFLLFTEGYRKSPVASVPHTALFSHFSELPDLIGELLEQARA